MIRSVMRKPLVLFKDEAEDPPGTIWGPVWILYFGNDPVEPEREEKLDEWLTRAQAQQLAHERGYDFQDDA